MVIEGGDVSLNCTAEGNPEPEVEWRFQNQSKLSGKGQAMLTISTVSFDDGGEYTCTATNDLGSVTKTVLLTVERESDPSSR